MKKIYIGVTDHNWFDQLSSISELEEVNFWSPSRKSFRAISEGELFLFRLKSPRNMIGGFGTLSTTMNTTIEFAWNNFGIRNGMNTLEEMVHSIGKYRKGLLTDRHTEIGSKLILNPVFLDKKDWIEAPSNWSPFTVTGKSYEISDPLIYETLATLHRKSKITKKNENSETIDLKAPNAEQEAVQFGMSLVNTRLGQAGFRYKVSKAYGLSCAISGTSVTSILDAAHIVPVATGGRHDIKNSLFLRKDLHKLFDLGLITITDELRVALSSKIIDVYKDDISYNHLIGKKIRSPIDFKDSPSREFLLWHRENIFHV